MGSACRYCDTTGTMWDGPRSRDENAKVGSQKTPPPLLLPRQARDRQICQDRLRTDGLPPRFFRLLLLNFSRIKNITARSRFVSLSLDRSCGSTRATRSRRRTTFYRASTGASSSCRWSLASSGTCPTYAYMHEDAAEQHFISGTLRYFS